MLSDRSLCDEQITRPEESYRLWCVVVCDPETSRMRMTWPALGRSTRGGRWGKTEGTKPTILTAWADGHLGQDGTDSGHNSTHIFMEKNLLLLLLSDFNQTWDESKIIFSLQC